jgi:hypothetical protein
MILKLRVPDYIEKHLVQQFTYNGETLYADLTVHRRQCGYGEIPVYTLDENNEAQFHDYFDGEILTQLGIR